MSAPVQLRPSRTHSLQSAAYGLRTVTLAERPDLAAVIPAVLGGAAASSSTSAMRGRFISRTLAEAPGTFA